MKKILITGLLISSVFFNVACDSDEIAAGAIGIGIGIGLGSLDDGNHHDGGHHDGYGHDHDRGGWDHGGYDGGHGRGRHCNEYRCFNTASVEASSAAPQFAATSFAQKHGITPAAGAKIQQAFANVNQSGLASFQAIGLDESALKSIMNRSVPNSASVRAMSQELNISEAQSLTLLQNLVSEFDQQAADGTSAYWQSCQAKGQWKTPQNAHCTTGAWSGCSPETGATLCY
jgi:hypothetical protein